MAEAAGPNCLTAETAHALLRAARGAVDWSRGKAGDQAGTHRNTIMRWETIDEQWAPRINYLRALLEASSESRSIVLGMLGLAPKELEMVEDKEFLEFIRRLYERRDEEAIQQTIELQRTLLGLSRRDEGAATA